MASNRDPRKSYRTNRRGRRITSSSDRSKRSKKSTVPKPTSSSTRASTKGSSSRVTTGQGGSRAKVKAKSTGLIGSTGNAPSRYVGPPGLGKKHTPGKFTDKPQVKANVKALQNSPLKYAKGLTSKAGAALTIAEGAAAALNRKPGKKDKMKPAPGMSQAAVKQAKKDSKETNRQSTAASFDRAFAAARKAGKKTFTWRGGTYSTKMA